MTFRRSPLALLAAPLALLAARARAADAPAAPAPVVTAVRAARLVDPATATVTRDAVVIVEGATIKQVGSGLAIPKGAAVIDLGDATLLPGLFDCHTHLCVNVRKPGGVKPRDFYEAVLTSTIVDTAGYRAILGVAHAREMLEAGFTSVRDVGNSGAYADTDLRRAIEEGVVIGPTVVNAGRIITPTGGQFSARLPPFLQELYGNSQDFIGVLSHERPGIGNPEYFYADTKDELVKAVRENVLYGARVIKIVVDDQPFIYSADDIRTVVQEAGRAGIRVAAHCLTETGARNAAEAGVASIEHGLLVSDETLALMKKNGVVLVGTDFTAQAGRDIGWPEGLHERVVERLRRAYKAGVTLAFGTDVFAPSPGLTRGQMAATYVESSVEAGLPPADILRQMTTNAARLLGLEKERGAIQAGLAADVIATAGNPLDDIMAVKRVVFVMKDGKVVVRPEAAMASPRGARSAQREGGHPAEPK